MENKQTKEREAELDRDLHSTYAIRLPKVPEYIRQAVIPTPSSSCLE